MVNVPYRSSESLMAEHIAVRTAAIRRTAGAMALAFALAFAAAALLIALPDDVRILHDGVPLDDPALAALLTA